MGVESSPRGFRRAATLVFRSMTTIRAAWWLLHDVTFPSFARHRLRTLLTLVGVIIGTQVVVAIARYDRKLWIVEPVTPAAYPPT